MFDANRNQGNCGSAPMLVDYLYGEIGDAEKESFELHLESCAECAEELASLSSLRLSINEWRESVPVQVAQSADREQGAGFLDAISAWIRAAFGTRMLAGAAAVALFLVLGLLALMIFTGDDGSPAVAGQGDPGPETAAPEPGARPNEVAPQASEPLVADVPDRAEPASPQAVRPESVRSTNPVKRSGKRVVTRPSAEMAEVSEPPRLSEAASEELEDDSLRLTDLFTDVSED